MGTAVLTREDMRKLDAATIAAGTPSIELMERAGERIAEFLIARGDALVRTRTARPALFVLAGPGNNGGDGLVVARHLHDAGARVALYVWHRRDTPDDANWQRCRQRDVAEYAASGDPQRADLRRLIGESELVVDALLGMGISRPVEGELAEIVRAVNYERPTAANRPPETAAQAQPSLVGHRSSVAVLAIDLPTGVDSDTGAVMGAALRADRTAATGLIKRGLLQYPGRLYAGAVEVVEIGLAPAQLEAQMSEMIDATMARKLLPPRPDDSHKGSFGKVMVIAGSPLYPGAASLATAGAARVGAGLVTLATGRSGLAAPGRLPEVTLQFLPEADWNSLGEAAADEALKQLENFQALLVGPGLGREEQTRTFLESLLGIESPRQRGHIGFRLGAAADQASDRSRPKLPPTVIDADGLTLLSQVERWWERLPRARCVLTPHPGEMKRLLGVDELRADHVKVAEEAANSWGQVVVLKGATTIVAEPEGHSAINDGGNAALATAGTGDVLAGAIAGLLAQGLAPRDAAALGVYLHSAAGRIVRDDLGDMGTIASDLLPRLPKAIKALKG